MEGGHRVSGIGYRAEKGVYASISLRFFAEWTHGSTAFPGDGHKDARKKTMALRAIISRAIGKDRENFHFSRASQVKGAPVSQVPPTIP
jgi:hypothetical protein